MKTKLFVLALILVAVPLFAQDATDPGRDHKHQLTVYASKVDFDDTDFGTDFTTDFENDPSFGASLNCFFTPHFAAEVSAFSLRSKASLLVGGTAALDLGKLDLTPISLGAQFHILGDRRFDPYIGAGVSYIIANDFHSADLEAVNLGTIELDSKASYYLNAGVAVEIIHGLGLVVDARKFNYETSSRSSVTGVEQDLDLSPLVLSGGLRFRF
jgi:outer membrane protein